MITLTDLKIEEIATLRGAGLDSTAYCVVEAPAAGMQMTGLQVDPNNGQASYVVILHIPLPKELLDLPIARLKTANGQDVASEKLGKAFAGATMRIVLRKDVLSETARTGLDQAHASGIES